MAWLRIDDTVPGHHKMLKAGPAACWVWVCGIAYCQRQLTDGFIPDEALSVIGVSGVSRVRRLCDVLVTVELFERESGGYRIHDYHDHNATAEEAAAHRQRISEKRAAAGRLGGISSAIVRRQATKQNDSNAQRSNEAPSPPFPSSTRTPLTPLAGAKGDRRITRAERQHAEHVIRLRFGKCVHEPACETHEVCVQTVAAELRAKVSRAAR